jgi:hypothetical protein
LSLRAQLAEQLARYDEDAFAALANRGLLRRAQKDLEKQPAEIVEETADTLTVACGPQRIRFDARGPAHAQCSCPATGVCQHILAAALSLQKLAAPAPAVAQEAAAAAAADAPSPEPADPLAALHAALLALTPAQLSKHAGKPGYRWAWQYVQDLAEPAEIGGERHIVIGFKHPRMSFRYLGGGIDSLIADTQLSQIEKYRVAAVLAYQRAHGVEVPAPEAPGAGRSGALDLGKDHALAESVDENLQASRQRLRGSVAQLLQESVELGLSHLSPGIQERYATLAVWAQGAEYYRLALLLRRIADHVEMLLERAGGADEHRLLDEIGLAYGLVGALEQAAAKNSAPSHLVGRSRSRYEQAGTLQLIGLGASAWRSAAGYVGLTMLFWSEADGAFVSCTDARPEIQRGFNPIARYKAAGPWSGLGAPAQATGRRLAVANAQINAQGRLSAAESVSATMQAYVEPVELAEKLRPAEDWAALLQARSLARRSLLAEPSPMKDWAVLRPARFGAAQFDPVRQTMVWPLFDSQEQALAVELVYSDYSSHAIGRIEQLGAGQLPLGTLLVARLHSTPSGLVAEPLSLIRPEAGKSGSAVDALHFDEAPAQGFASRWLDKLRARGSGKAAAETGAGVAAMPAALRELRQFLQTRAERGIAGGFAEHALAELRRHAEQAGTAGLPVFAKAQQGGLEPAAAILRTHYLCMQYERLVQDVVEDSE